MVFSHGLSREQGCACTTRQIPSYWASWVSLSSLLTFSILYCEPYAIIGSEILKFEPSQKKTWTMQLKKTQIQDSRTCDKIAKNYFSLAISWILEQTVAVFKSPRVHGTYVIYLVPELLELLKFSALEPLPH